MRDLEEEANSVVSTLKITSLPGNHASPCKRGGLRVQGREGVAPAQDSELERKDRRDVQGANVMQSKNVLVILERRASEEEIRMLPGNVVF